MKRICVVLISGALAASCGGSPASPTSARTPAVPGATTSVRIETAAPGFAGAAAVAGSIAHCFAGSGAPACYSATVMRPQGVVAGAVAPGAPTGLTATASGSSVTLTWSVPVGGDPVQSYVIEAGSTTGASNLANLLTGTTATTFSTGGVPNGTYFVRVRASNGAGLSAPSNEAILVVGPAACTAAPGPPGNLFASATTNGTVTVTWTAASGAPTSYVIEAGSASGLSNLANSDLGGTPLTYTATGVGVGTYYIRLRAKNACGLGVVSNEFRLVVSIPVSSVTVTSVSPTSGSVNGGTLVSVRGSGFKSGLAVTFGGAAATVTIFSSTSISAFTPAHAAGAVDVVVTNGDGQTATRASAFTYVAETSTDNWRGTTGQGLPMSFAQGTSAITSFTVAYTIPSCGLTGTLGILSTTVSVSSSGSFSYDGGTPFGGGSALAISGTLTGSSGSGTLTVRTSAIFGIGGCNGSVTTTWSATKS